MSDFRLHVLGCGSAKPSVKHHPSCYVVEHHGTLYMIDCGEGAQLEFQRQKLKFSRLRHIFLTHLHGDHVLGLPGLVATLGLGGKEGKLTIHTFEEGADILDRNFKFFSRDLSFELEFDVIRPEEKQILDTGALKVRTIPLKHRIPDVGYVFEENDSLRHIRRDMCDFHGVPLYKFREIKEGADFVKEDGIVIPNEDLTTPGTKGARYAHMSDTVYMPDLAERIGDVDLLFHETTYLRENAADAEKRFHSTAEQAAMVARDAGARCLLTGHYSSRYRDDNLFVAEASTIFPATIAGREGLSLPIRQPQTDAVDETGVASLGKMR